MVQVATGYRAPDTLLSDTKESLPPRPGWAGHGEWPDRWEAHAVLS